MSRRIISLWEEGSKIKSVSSVPKFCRNYCIDCHLHNTHRYSALASGTDHEAKKVMAIAQDIEAAALSHFKSVSDQYKSKLRSLVSNVT